MERILSTGTMLLFNSEEDYRQFLIYNTNSGDYNVIFPCPTNDSLLNQTLPKDESVK